MATRQQSIDILRGLVMIIMTLDHVRDFFHNDAMMHDPLDLQTTTPLLFFTRWITHFCAPVFVFLSGVSAWLSGSRKDPVAFQRFLIKRGLWLILAEFAIISLGWSFDPLYHILVFQVIWAIGISMVFLGLLSRLPFYVLVTIGSVIVLGHNLLDYPEAGLKGDPGFLWSLLHKGGFAMYPVNANHALLIIYPFVPWLGLMILGYCSGRILSGDQHQRRRFLLQGGAALLICFILLRAVNLYGDPHPWTYRSDIFYTLLSFVDVSKYPPSLMFTFMTIGVALLLLYLFEKYPIPLRSYISVFGRVPFFFYIAHIYFIHLLVVIVFFISGYGADHIITEGSPFLFRPPQLGYNLAGVYLIWISVVVLLYFPCRWYERKKFSNPGSWMKYI